MTSEILAPAVGFAAGFTLYVGPAALDMAFMHTDKNANVPSAIYSAVGAGLGSSTTSIVLSFKL